MLPVELENKKEGIRLEVEKLGAELVDLDARRTSGRTVVTLVVDKPGGIALDDCARINAHLGLFLDGIGEAEGGFFNAPYLLEVSSPGLDRRLKTERDFQRVVGQALRVTYRLEDGRTVTSVLKLVSLDEDVLGFENPANGQRVSMKMPSVIKAVREITF
ncbi:MAG: ribosome maturation factor RimP [Candidatus Omnitrophica bacterium]|nr:ribosome maturation factor RimP [Candidatus Omnitrophota bacterium]